MQQFFVDSEHVFEFVRTARVSLSKDAHLRSRCIDGRYESVPDLPAFTFPGADAGEFLLVVAAAQQYGFEVVPAKVFEVLSKLVGGVDHLRFHTDEHAGSGDPLKGCGYITQVKLHPQEYGILPADVLYIESALAQAQKEGARQTVLRGDHSEGVVVFVKGPYTVMPQADILVENRRHHIQAFVYHQTLADIRHKQYAKELIDQKAVVLAEGLDDSYLYQALSEVAETQLMETLKLLAKGLPIYEAVFDKDGLFEIEDLGLV